MRKLITLVCLIGLLTLAHASVALAHPSESRHDKSTFGGPHCHINLVSGKDAFPSHRGHVATGDSVFAAVGECPS